MATFTNSPDYSAQKKTTPRVRKAQFGDGYEQRAVDGLNTKMKSWTCSFKRSTEEAASIFEFFQTQGGVYAFNWTDPDGYAAAWICEEWTLTRDNFGWSTVNAVLREVPEEVA